MPDLDCELQDCRQVNWTGFDPCILARNVGLYGLYQLWVGGVAQLLGCRSLTGGLSFIYAW